ncbi:UDP-GalNAc:beta-1,3-N-acetylgalactosaminyltransferase 1-like [Pleurodeles waltl]|uniref:UDP-GalNAc:beta-1, 3-N-acetylgalactosaminyltransferase 1-like n=1 Tax=Pleurodeles waltl TaxID=8319 RepID=UPI0037097DD9
MSANYFICLKLGFLALVGTTVTIVMCLIMQQSPTLVEKMNWIYFYEYEPIYKTNFTFTQHVKCKDTNPFLVILVSSRPKDTFVRQAIRITWGSVNMWFGHHVKTLFLLGQEPNEDARMETLIEYESKLNGDIIRQDFLDTYHNLTLKTIMAFQWVSQFCPNAKYIMKADSDVFINTPNLLNFLLTFNSSDSLFTGYPLFDNYVQRSILHKAYISYLEYPFRIYPHYCSGLGYVLSGKLALKIYEVMSHVKPIWIEDAYVGICLKVLNVAVHAPRNPELFVLYAVEFSLCEYRKACAVHGLSSNEIIKVWDAIQKNTLGKCS